MQNPFPAPATQDGYQSFNGTCSASERVNLANGNMEAVVTLVDVPTIGLPFRFVLTYNALDCDTLGEMGYGWRHTYMLQLQFTGTGPDYTYVTFIEDSGRRYVRLSSTYQTKITGQNHVLGV